MILDIKGASASWADNELHVAFDVVPEGFSHLDLKTGEIFQSSTAAAVYNQKGKAISATLFVTRRVQNAAGAQLPSEMRYVPGIGEEGSKVHLIWRLPDDHLAGFHSLVLAGRTPRQASIFFPVCLQDVGLEIALEGRDSLGWKWNNEKSPSVPIENVSFNCELYAPSTDQSLITEVPEGHDRAFFSDAASVNFALLRRLSSIESSLARLSRTVELIVLLILGLALYRFLH